MVTDTLESQEGMRQGFLNAGPLAGLQPQHAL